MLISLEAPLFVQNQKSALIAVRWDLVIIIADNVIDRLSFAQCLSQSIVHKIMLK